MKGTPARRPRGPSFRAAARRVAGWLRWLVLAASIAYPVVLLAIWLSFAFIGERWWLTAVALYAPRAPFLLPLPVLVIALLVVRRRDLLWTQALGLAIGLFPLMGFGWSWPGERGPGAVIRVMSFNANGGHAGYREIARAVTSISPDIAFFQEAEWGTELVDLLKKRYPHVETSTQFIVASRFPIRASIVPDRIPFWGRQRSPRFMHHRIDTPLGELAFFNVHPLSPRGVLNVYRFRGALHALRSGELFGDDSRDGVGANAGLRSLQIEAVARLAKAERVPVVILGDTNLPGQSATLRRNLGDYQDGFEEAGRGFGYTFPAKYPWMRLDRILASEELRFLTFETACHGLSDHLCVYADIQRRWIEDK